MVNPNNDKVYLLCENHEQFAVASNTFNRFGIPPKNIMRVACAESLRYMPAGVRIIGLPGWKTLFTRHELALLKTLASKGKHSLYQLTETKFAALQLEAQDVFNSMKAAKALVYESPEGGDFPDS